MGAARSSHVIIALPDYQAALECTDSLEYRHAMGLRKSASDADILIVEGYDDP